ncbi:hypothetical protein [Priestia megaterium]
MKKTVKGILAVALILGLLGTGVVYNHEMQNHNEARPVSGG